MAWPSYFVWAITHQLLLLLHCLLFGSPLSLFIGFSSQRLYCTWDPQPGYVLCIRCTYTLQLQLPCGFGLGFVAPILPIWKLICLLWLFFIVILVFVAFWGISNKLMKMPTIVRTLTDRNFDPNNHILNFIIILLWLVGIKKPHLVDFLLKNHKKKKMGWIPLFPTWRGKFCPLGIVVGLHQRDYLYKGN